MSAHDESDKAVIPFEVKWETNMFNQPALINQMSMTQGPTTQFGNDGIYYLLLGHVMPPMGDYALTESGSVELSVMPAGQFAFTLERVRELHRILGIVIADAEGGDTIEDDN